MLKLGQYNKLKVKKKDPQGYYLEGDSQSDDIFLPNKYATVEIKINESIEVFLFLDSNKSLTATTQKPYACVGDFVNLKVSSKEEFGAFLDWGLEKNLFLPFREQLFELYIEQDCVVYIYIDSSQRISASTRIEKFIDKTPHSYSVGDQVEVLIYQITDLGVKAIINNKHSGLIFHDQIIGDLKIGQNVSAYIKNIREDKKIDLSLYPDGLKGRKDLSDQILDKIKEHGGSLNITSKTSADIISSTFNVSRKKFKVALGYLYKKKLISIEDSRIKLI